MASCANDDSENELSSEACRFEDGFEAANGDISELFPSDNSRWSNIQQVDPMNGANVITINREIVNEGTGSLKIVAKASDEQLSKMDIEKNGFAAPTGSTVRIEADFYINSTENIRDLLLIDLECCSCWDPMVANNQCPGVRLMMSGGNDYLAIERGKILGSTLAQSSIAFPRKQWVNVVWEMKLSPDDDGENKLFIDGREAVVAQAMNVPNAALFAAEAASQGIEFQLQEPVVYERIQIGATTNPTIFDIEMYIDNFKITIR